MNTMAKRVTIDYRWTRDDDGEIPKDHLEQLEESAMERIQEMMKKGYLMGELSEILGDDEVSYSGWWGTKTEDQKEDN